MLSSVESPNYDNLPLFQSSHSLDSNPVLDRGLQQINNMIELNYIKYDNGLTLTNSGIEYMLRNHDTFYKNLNPDVDFGELTEMIEEMKSSYSKGGFNIPKRFAEQNLLIGKKE